ncbi:hypothetical protein HPP92_019794 [Vanilla planifolia]|uniref:Uncharacterized protein n=1 Tax=Vanilla planifolia TaxID=51239 RepID=A0A835Q7F5_VANPL|nr:hypothetical protein HPP92_019794 [Vanilla planifolia]
MSSADVAHCFVSPRLGTRLQSPNVDETALSMGDPGGSLKDSSDGGGGRDLSGYRAGRNDLGGLRSRISGISITVPFFKLLSLKNLPVPPTDSARCDFPAFLFSFCSSIAVERGAASIVVRFEIYSCFAYDVNVVLVAK